MSQLLPVGFVNSRVLVANLTSVSAGDLVVGQAVASGTGRADHVVRVSVVKRYEQLSATVRLCNDAPATKVRLPINTQVLIRRPLTAYVQRDNVPQIREQSDRHETTGLLVTPGHYVAVGQLVAGDWVCVPQSADRRVVQIGVTVSPLVRAGWDCECKNAREHFLYRPWMVDQYRDALMDAVGLWYRVRTVKRQGSGMAVYAGLDSYGTLVSDQLVVRSPVQVEAHSVRQED